MKNILFILLSFCLAGEMEVDGDLKVTGTVDANGNPITNVGAAISMTDAINGNVLQSALRDDGVYEHKIYAIQSATENHTFAVDYQECIPGQDILSNNWMGRFHDELLTLLNDGWKIDQTIDLSPTGWGGGAGGDAYYSKKLFIFKRPISDD